MNKKHLLNGVLIFMGGLLTTTSSATFQGNQQPATTKRLWSLEEDQCLSNIVELLKAKNWLKIAEHIPNHSAKSCRERWHEHLDPSISHAPFGEDEEKKLANLVKQYGTQWSKIVKFFDHRTKNDIKNHCYHFLKHKYKHRQERQFWNKEDDQKLTLIIQLNGTGKWKEIAKNFPNRNARQCRDRWNDYLKFGLNFEPWTEAEDRLLLELVKKDGHRWTSFTKRLNNRTQNAIKNRYYNYLIEGKNSSNFKKLNPPDSDQQILQLQPLNHFPIDHRFINIFGNNGNF